MDIFNIIAVSSALLFSITLAFQKDNIVKPLEIHHLYIGLLIAGLGNLIKSPVVIGMSDALAVDDSIQHFIQAAFYPKFQSPLHYLYARYLWPMSWVQQLTAWLNGLFK